MIAAQPAGDRAPRATPRLVSVIVPVLDAERWIGEQLSALADQTYEGAWEILVVDNGCADRSIEVARSWAARLPALRVVSARDRRSLNHARNVGVRAARGDFLAFCDADDVVLADWLDALLVAAPTCDIVGGGLDVESLNQAVCREWRPQEPIDDLPVEHGFLPYVAGGNCGVWADVARELGWDEDFEFGSSDTEFSWRAQLASYRLTFAPDAIVRVRYRSTIRDLARQYYAYGRSAPPLYRRFRRLGMRRDLRGAFALWGWLLWHVPDVARSPARRGNWVRVAAFRLGRIHGSLSARVLFL